MCMAVCSFGATDAENACMAVCSFGATDARKFEIKYAWEMRFSMRSGHGKPRETRVGQKSWCVVCQVCVRRLGKANCEGCLSERMRRKRKNV